MATSFAPLEAMVVPEELEESSQPLRQGAMKLEERTQPGMESLGERRGTMEVGEGIPEGMGNGLKGRWEELRNRKAVLLFLLPAANDGGLGFAVQAHAHR